MRQNNLVQFLAGDSLIAPGADGARGWLIVSGRARLTGPGTTADDIVDPGELVGEIGLVTGRAHRIGAVALESVAALPVGRADLYEAFRQFGTTSRPLANHLMAMSNVADLDGLAAAYGAADAPPEGTPSAPDPMGQQWSRMHFVADTAEVAGQLPTGGIEITHLPFRVGRAAEKGENRPRMEAELVLRDARPFTVSRHHFVIEEMTRGLVCRDSGSQLGTIVNGAQIGVDEATNIADLRIGKNTIIAGRLESVFRFHLTVEAD